MATLAIMAQPLVVEQSRAMPVTGDAAFDGTVPLPLPTLFHRWYGPIPPIKEVVDQTGDWDAVGKTRTVVLTGGGSMRERLTSYDPPRSFGYTLSDVKGPMAPLVDHVDGLWSFEPAGTGTRVTWRWTIHPRSAFSAPLLPVFGRLWLGYARQSLEELSNQLVR
jgi:polyketide cyclase/dehydrase/lipid transport protein